MGQATKEENFCLRGKPQAENLPTLRVGSHFVYISVRSSGIGSTCMRIEFFGHRTVYKNLITPMITPARVAVKPKLQIMNRFICTLS